MSCGTLPYPLSSSDQNAAASDLRKNAEEGTKKKTTNERKKGKVIRKPPSQNESFPFLLSSSNSLEGRMRDDFDSVIWITSREA